MFELDDSATAAAGLEATPLEAVIQQSKENVAAIAPKGKGGRPAKYLNDQARHEAKLQRNREYKARLKARGRGDGSAIREESEAGGRVDPEPRPAGLAPFLDSAADMPVHHFRAAYGLTPAELPDLQREKKDFLVAQADMVIGIFCPNAANNKWVMLGALLSSVAMIYGGVAAQARAIAAQKYPEASAGGDPPAGPELSIPTAVVG
jgi:hypothetical protein